MQNMKRLKYQREVKWSIYLAAAAVVGDFIFSTKSDFFVICVIVAAVTAVAAAAAL